MASVCNSNGGDLLSNLVIDVHFYDHLVNCLSPDNVTRLDSEKKIEKADYQVVLRNLSAVLFSEKSPHNAEIYDPVKIVSSTIIKNQFPKLKEVEYDGFNKFPLEVEKFFVTLINIFTKIHTIPAKSIDTRFKVANLIGEKVFSLVSLSEKHNFHSFLEMMLKNLQVQSTDPTSLVSKIIALTAVSKISKVFKKYECSFDVIVNTVGPFCSNTMTLICSSGSIHKDHEELCVEIITGLSTLIESAPEIARTKDIRLLSDLLVKFACHFLQQKTMSNSFDRVLSSLHSVVVSNPRLFNSCLDDMIDVIIFILSLGEFDVTKQVKSLAIIIYTAVFEYNVKLLTTGQNKEKFNKIIELFVQHMDDPDHVDVIQYPGQQSDEDEDATTSYSAQQAEIAFDKICCIVPEIMFDFVKLVATRLLSAEATVSQNIAGINIVSCAGEGCRKYYEEHFDTILTNFILPMVVTKRHPKIRFAALTALGVTCTEFRSLMVGKYHNQIIEAFQVALADRSNVKVRAQAFIALNNFFEVCPDYLIPTVVPKLTPMFTDALTNLQPNLLENVLTAITNICERQLLFDQFYSCIREPLQNLIKQHVSGGVENNTSLLTELISTMCFIGCKTDLSNFGTDVEFCLKGVFDIFKASGGAHLELDVLFSTLANVANCLGVAFKPFAQESIALCSQYLEKLSEQFSKGKLGNMFYEESDIDNDEFKVHSTLHNACQIACGLIAQICNSIGKSVYPLVSKLIPLLTDFIQNTYFKLAPFESISAIITISDNINESTHSTYLVLMKVVYEQVGDSMSECNILIEIVMEALKVVGKAFVNAKLKELLHQIMTKCIERQIVSNNKVACLQDFKTNEEVEEQDDFEELLFEDYCDNESGESFFDGFENYVGGMFKMFGDEFVPLFNIYVQAMQKIDSSKYVEVQILPLVRIWSTVIECASPTVINNYASVIQAIFHQYSSKEDFPAVKRILFFIINQLVSIPNNTAPWVAFVTQNLQQLLSYIQDNQNTINDASQLAIDNGVSALVSILRSMPEVVDRQFLDCLKLILQNLPMKSDYEELPNAYKFICEILESDSYQKLDAKAFQLLFAAIASGYEIVKCLDVQSLIHFKELSQMAIGTKETEPKQILPRLVTALRQYKTRESAAFDNTVGTLSNDQKNILSMLVTQ